MSEQLKQVLKDLDYGILTRENNEFIKTALNDYEHYKLQAIKSDEKIKAFNLIVEYEINISFFKYCCDKRRGLQIFNQGRLGDKKLKYEDYEFLRKVIYENT